MMLFTVLGYDLSSTLETILERPKEEIAEFLRLVRTPLKGSYWF